MKWDFLLNGGHTELNSASSLTPDTERAEAAPKSSKRKRTGQKTKRVPTNKTIWCARSDNKDIPQKNDS